MITLFGKPEPTLLERLKESVSKTRSALSESVTEIFAGEKEIDPKLLGQLEKALLAADLGVKTTREVLDAVRQKMERNALGDAAAVKAEIKAQLMAVLQAAGKASENGRAQPLGEARDANTAQAAPLQPISGGGEKPRVVFVVGVNGTGKTTTIGKLANRLRAEGKSVVLCAADTFRAAAIEQLAIWAERTGAPMIKQKPGADPAAVVFDAVAAAKSRGADAVIVDTAGRLHNKANLMAELEKMKRTAAKLVPGAPHDILLVLDATTGQNGLVQAREFTSAVGVTGLVLTKLDGTAKGGIVVAIARELGLPIEFVGVGEKIGDLVPFDAGVYVGSLLD